MAQLVLSSTLRGPAIPSNESNILPPVDLGLFNSLPLKYFKGKERQLTTISTLFMAVGDGIQFRALYPNGSIRTKGRLYHDAHSKYTTHHTHADGQVYNMVLTEPILPINQMGGITKVTLVDIEQREIDEPYRYYDQRACTDEHDGVVPIDDVHELTMNHIARFQINNMLIRFTSTEMPKKIILQRTWIHNDKLKDFDKDNHIYYGMNNVACRPHGLHKNLVDYYKQPAERYRAPHKARAYAGQPRGWGWYGEVPALTINGNCSLFWRIPKTGPLVIEWWCALSAQDMTIGLFYNKGRTHTLSLDVAQNVVPNQINSNSAEYSALALTSSNLLFGTFDANFERTADGVVATADVLNTSFRVIGCFFKAIGKAKSEHSAPASEFDYIDADLFALMTDVFFKRETDPSTGVSYVTVMDVAV